ncbi:NifB/NifX family molybdenum-iron cluster-binding protein [Candidatus Parcubacteria bacterium]|nr:NifB/NifX family molybdenum-iron cluster-binding protein [Candidatus Parcubacteria bacterium]
MKIAISSTGKNLESEIDARFGRCPYFLIVEIDDKEISAKGGSAFGGKSVKAIENTAAGQMGGAGITAAEIVANEKVSAVITTNLGPRALSVFEQFRIKIYQGQGKIKDAIQKFIKGELTEITNSTGPMRAGFR